MLSFHFRWDVCFSLYFVYVCMYVRSYACPSTSGGRFCVLLLDCRQRYTFNFLSCFCQVVNDLTSRGPGHTKRFVVRGPAGAMEHTWSYSLCHCLRCFAKKWCCMHMNAVTRICCDVVSIIKSSEKKGGRKQMVASIQVQMFTPMASLVLTCQNNSGRNEQSRTK